MLAINLNTKLITAADYHGATSQAYRLGRLSAQLQEAFAPEAIFRRPTDMIDFALGFESVTGPSIFTRQFTSKVVQQ